MGSAVERPIIFPLSNPTAKSEAVPEDLLRWTNGRAVIATGSPFPSVDFGTRRISIAQCNNVYIFPAVGLGVVASGARRITNEMILVAARALARESPARSDPTAPLLPRIRDLRRTAVEIGMAVGLEAQRTGNAPQTTPEELRERLVATQWTPCYPSYGERCEIPGRNPPGESNPPPRGRPASGCRRPLFSRPGAMGLGNFLR